MNSDNENSLKKAKLLYDSGMNVSKIADEIDIPYKTTYNHLKNINHTFDVGRPKLLPRDIEEKLIEVANYMAEHNLGLNLRRFKKLASEIYDTLHPDIHESKRPIFSNKWWKNFKKRHSEFKGRHSKKNN